MLSWILWRINLFAIRDHVWDLKGGLTKYVAAPGIYFLCVWRWWLHKGMGSDVYLREYD